MSDLKDLAERGDVLKPFGELDVLLLYVLASSELAVFLGDREVASRVWLKERTLLNRGSYLPPLHVGEIAGISSDLLQARSRMSLPRGYDDTVQFRLCVDDPTGVHRASTAFARVSQPSQLLLA